MKRSCTLIVMSLALLLGLWGYSMSMDSPFPKNTQEQMTTGNPANDDHPWGGDQGQGGGGNPTVIGPTNPYISTGNVVTDVVVNRIMFHGKILRMFFPTKTQTAITGSTVKSTTPTSSTGNNAN